MHKAVSPQMEKIKLKRTTGKSQIPRHDFLNKPGNCEENSLAEPYMGLY